jgi:hypothetical protein
LGGTASRDTRRYIPTETRTTRYIVTGERGEGDKQGKEGALIARYVTKTQTSPVSEHSVEVKGENANIICASFKEAAEKHYAAKYAVASENAHALGLDCLGQTTTQVRYFDPNLGEFLFQDIDKFVEWWRKCYLTRNDGGGAFGMMKDAFTAYFYVKLKL